MERTSSSKKRVENRKIIIVNQASNYLTVGLCNAFDKNFGQVTLISGSIHEQGEELNNSVKVEEINRWVERPVRKKLFSYLSACWSIYWLLLLRYRKHEVLFVSLPPMAYLMSIILPNKCSMLIWDVYPDIFKIMGMSESNIVYRLWASFNKVAFRKAFKLFTVGNRMANLLEKYASKDKILITPIWSIFQSNGKVAKSENPFIKKVGLEEKFIVQYSGNIGLTHNVEVMVELAEKMKNEEKIVFQIIGRGPRVPHLRYLVEEKSLPNCQFLPFQPDEMFPYSLSAADIGVVILDAVTSKGSVPSKSYNLMSYGIPSLYIASEDSELQDYSKRYRHAECFDEKHLRNAAKFILELSQNADLYEKYKQNALEASKNFRRKNADKIVNLYI